MQCSLISLLFTLPNCIIHLLILTIFIQNVKNILYFFANHVELKVFLERQLSYFMDDLCETK